MIYARGVKDLLCNPRYMSPDSGTAGAARLHREYAKAIGVAEAQPTRPAKSDDLSGAPMRDLRRSAKAWRGGCPCGDPALCHPIRTPRPSRDVFAAGADGLTNVSDNTQIDWDTVTIVADVRLPV